MTRTSATGASTLIQKTRDQWTKGPAAVVHHTEANANASRRKRAKHQKVSTHCTTTGQQVRGKQPKRGEPVGRKKRNKQPRGGTRTRVKGKANLRATKRQTKENITTQPVQKGTEQQKHQQEQLLEENKERGRRKQRFKMQEKKQEPRKEEKRNIGRRIDPSKVEMEEQRPKANCQQITPGSPWPVYHVGQKPHSRWRAYPKNRSKDAQAAATRWKSSR